MPEDVEPYYSVKCNKCKQPIPDGSIHVQLFNGLSEKTPRAMGLFLCNDCCLKLKLWLESEDKYIH